MENQYKAVNMHPTAAGGITVTTAGTGAAHDQGLAPLQEVTVRVRRRKMEKKKNGRKIKMMSVMIVMSAMRDLVAEEDLVAGEDIAGHGMADAVVVPPGRGRMRMENIQVVRAQEKNENLERREGKINVRDRLAVADDVHVQGDPVHQKEKRMRRRSRRSRKNIGMGRQRPLPMTIKDQNVHMYCD